MSTEALALSLFVHLSATVIWIGGLMVTVILVLPEARRILDQQVSWHLFLQRLRQRFYPISNLCLVALIVTGLFQTTASPHYDGFLTFDNRWSQVLLVKHIIIVVMALVGLLLQYGVAPSLERTSILLAQNKAQADSHAIYTRLRRREIVLTWLLVGLGLSILGLSAWLGAL